MLSFLKHLKTMNDVNWLTEFSIKIAVYIILIEMHQKHKDVSRTVPMPNCKWLLQL